MMFYNAIFYDIFLTKIRQQGESRVRMRKSTLTLRTICREVMSILGTKFGEGWEKDEEGQENFVMSLSYPYNKGIIPAIAVKET